MGRGKYHFGVKRGRIGGGDLRLYHYSLLFTILFMGIVAMINADEGVKGRIGWERQLMDRCVDGAADAAAEYMATYSDGRIQIDREEVGEVFFLNLFSALGVLDSIPEQKRLYECVVCMVILDGDGFYLWHKGDGGNAFCWEEKVFFVEGEREKILEEAVLGAIRQHGEEKEIYGREYRLELPMGEGILKRALAERGIFVMLRGIPGVGRCRVYEHFAFSGAVLYKTN